MLVGFDIDGTLADLEHRRKFIASRPKNWAAFNNGMDQDAPIHEIIAVANALNACGVSIFFASGREGKVRHRIVTQGWLAEHVGQWTAARHLFMRPEGDFRPDDLIKEEILDNHVIPTFGRAPDLIFDDRNRVVNMWRRRGIRVAQVAPGDF